MPTKVTTEYWKCNLCRARYDTEEEARKCEEKGMPGNIQAGSMVEEREFPAPFRRKNNIGRVIDILCQEKTHEIIYYVVCVAENPLDHKSPGCGHDFWLTPKTVELRSETPPPTISANLESKQDTTERSGRSR